MKKSAVIIFLLFSSKIFSQSILYEMLIDKYDTEKCSYEFINSKMKIIVYSEYLEAPKGAVVISEYNPSDNSFSAVNAFAITEKYLFEKDGNKWLVLRDDWNEKYFLKWNPKAKKAEFSNLYHPRCPQKFTFISSGIIDKDGNIDRTLIDNKVSSLQKQYDKDLKIANDKIKIISNKITSNNIVDDEIVQEFESIKSKLVFIPKVYSDYLENLKSENEKIKNNLIYEELVDITKSEFNDKEVATEIDSIYKELNEENKVKYGKFVDSNYLNSEKDTIHLNRLTTDFVKKHIQSLKDSGYLDNSIIIFEGEYNYGDHIAVDRGTYGYETGSGYISVNYYNNLSKQNETENIGVWKNGFKNLIEIGTGEFAYSIDKNLFYLEIKVTSMNNDERNTNYGKPNNYKSTLTSLQDGKLLPLIIGINENGLLNIFKTIDKKKILSQYSNDKDLVKNVGNIKNYLEVIPFQDTFTFYNSTVNQSNRNKPSITFEGWDLSIGKKLYIKDKNGKDIPIPDGKYKLEDLNRIETKSGVIVKVKGISYGDIIILPESARNKKLPPNIKF